MKETTAAKTIGILQLMFSQIGLPEQLVTDNGPQFVSDDFAQFTKQNGVKHIHCAPYHPATNGLAEQFVQSLKMALKASVNTTQSSEFPVQQLEHTTYHYWGVTSIIVPASTAQHQDGHDLPRQEVTSVDQAS